MPNLFHGYPIPPDRHPEHVNWRETLLPTSPRSASPGFVRDDGVSTKSSSEVARLDRESPMPRPPVLVGQVWRRPDRMFPEVHDWGCIPTPCLLDADGRWHPVTLPVGSDLVWGPFAPWQDTGAKP